MHTLQLQIDNSIFDKFMGLLDILPKKKNSDTNGLELDDAFDKILKS